MNHLKKLVLFAAVLSLAVAAMGQGQRRGMFGMGAMAPTQLLNRDDVKDELKLTTDQRGKIADALQAARDKGREVFQSLGIDFRNMTDDDRAKMRKAMEEVNASSEKDINAILTADQQKRLRELFVQQTGNMVAMNPSYQKELGITDDQKAKFADLQKKQQQAMQDLFQKVQSGDMDRSAMGEAMQKNTQIMKDEVGKILTEDQKGKIKSWSGTPFTFKEDGGR